MFIVFTKERAWVNNLFCHGLFFHVSRCSMVPTMLFTECKAFSEMWLYKSWMEGKLSLLIHHLTKPYRDACAMRQTASLLCRKLLEAYCGRFYLLNCCRKYITCWSLIQIVFLCTYPLLSCLKSINMWSAEFESFFW